MNWLNGRFKAGTQWTLQKDNITIETGTIDNNITEITYEFSNWQSDNPVPWQSFAPAHCH